jgi:hypothetical protein
VTEGRGTGPEVTVSTRLHEKPSLAPKARIRFDVRSDTHFLVYPERALELSGSAPELVLACKGDRTLEEVIRNVAAEQDASFAAAAKEALPFFAELERRGLLIWR